MGFFKKGKRGNYDLWSGYSWYIPGVSGMMMMLGMLLAGALLGNLTALLLSPFLGTGSSIEFVMLVSYPVMFIPAMMYAKLKSNRNMLFERGVAMDSNHFGKHGGLVAGLVVMTATLALSFNMDFVTSKMPDMPEQLENALSSMTGGSIWVNLLCTGVFAALFEEWLCRGIVLRGLLNARRPDGSTMKPAWAIILSALFFAIIHMNPWQAIPAFALGCLFGYVYYRTGSLKLVMLMHFTNNTFALLLGHTETLKEAQTWLDILPAPLYWIIFTACILLLILIIRYLARIPLATACGNCDEIPEEEVAE